jgi:hypothetical protein
MKLQTAAQTSRGMNSAKHPGTQLRCAKGARWADRGAKIGIGECWYLSNLVDTFLVSEENRIGPRG